MPRHTRCFTGVRQTQTAPRSWAWTDSAPSASARTYDETPHRDAAPVTGLLPRRPGVRRAPSEILHPGAHFAGRGSVAALPTRLAALEARADSRTRTLQHVAEKQVGQDAERPQHPQPVDGSAFARRPGAQH